jgi:hypothetical protein
MSPDDFESTFGVKPDAKDKGITDSLRVKLLRGMGSAPIAEGIEVHELWQKPSRQHPRGYYALWTNKHVIKVAEELPYEYLIRDGGRLPFTQLGSLRRPDSLYYTCPVSTLRPAQMVWNKFIAQAIMSNDHFANLKWWIPKELQLQKMPDGSPHQILQGDAGPANLKPEILAPPAIPDSSRLMEMTEQQMMHLVSVHEVSQGQVPGRVEAAKAIELLKSSDEGMYKHLLDTIDSSIAQGGWQILMMGREFESAAKQVIVYSRDGAPIVKHWRRDAVQPGTRVRPVRMSGLGRTRAQRQDSLNLMWQNKIITDPDVYAQLLDMPIPSFDNIRAMDIRRAQSENIEMAAGIPVKAAMWDNHAVHIQQHNEYRKTQEYHVLDAREKAIFEWHVTRHEQMQLIVARKTALLQMALMPPQPTGGAAPTMGPDQTAPSPDTAEPPGAAPPPTG